MFGTRVSRSACRAQLGRTAKWLLDDLNTYDDDVREGYKRFGKTKSLSSSAGRAVVVDIAMIMCALAAHQLCGAELGAQRRLERVDQLVRLHSRSIHS